MGGTGDSPVPAGDSPTGISGALVKKPAPLLIGRVAAMVDRDFIEPAPTGGTFEEFVQTASSNLTANATLKSSNPCSFG
ncbi:MAG: hypothetical protein HY735_34800 [Verrucomicrobia bacterium]|nr:hypothetical protein [Verrucomicrobiota bacterium]